MIGLHNRPQCLTLIAVGQADRFIRWMFANLVDPHHSIDVRFVGDEIEPAHFQPLAKSEKLTQLYRIRICDGLSGRKRAAAMHPDQGAIDLIALSVSFVVLMGAIYGFGRWVKRIFKHGGTSFDWFMVFCCISLIAIISFYVIRISKVAN